MPTDEFKKLLDRDFAKASAQPLTEITTPLLPELVNAALMAFRRSEVEAAEKGKENEDVAAFILFRQIIELADGIEVLFAHSCGTPAIPSLRSQFEASVGLSYLLSEDANYVERSLSWLVANIHSGIRERGTLEPGTAKGEQYEKLYEREFGRPATGQPNAAIAAEIKAMEDGLQNPQFAPIEAEYQRSKKAVNRVPPWYSLFGGPRNLAELAEATGNGALYRLLYGDWSGLGHANDLRRFLSSENGRPMFDAVRRPDELQHIAQHSALLLLRAIRQMINKFRHGESLVGWYLREVKPLLDRLSNLQIEFTPIVER